MLRTLATGAAVAGGGALAACGAAQVPAKELPPPETTSVRIVNPLECDPGLWLARDYLREEGITDVTFVTTQFTSRDWITKNLADVSAAHPEFIVGTIDAGLPLVVLSGLHSGCLELWVSDGIANVHDLRGRRVSVRVNDISDQFYAFFATLLGYIGIPLTAVFFVAAAGPNDYAGMISAFTEGRADAVLAGSAQGPILRRRPKAPGRVILDTMMDKPWSTYLCCHLVANREWARKNPIATKRVTRALLLATDAAAKDIPRAARDAAASGLSFTDASLTAETMAMCTYDWRGIEPEETLRFFGRRLFDLKLIKSTPQQLIAQGTDFAYMRQLKRELPKS